MNPKALTEVRHTARTELRKQFPEGLKYKAFGFTREIGATRVIADEEYAQQNMRLDLIQILDERRYVIGWGTRFTLAYYEKCGLLERC